MKTKTDSLTMKPARASCTLVCILGFALEAGAATIDFESLAGMDNAIVPVPAASQLSDQFLSTLGVSFSSGSPYVAVVNLGLFHATSGINAIGGSTPGGLLTYDGAFPIVATFFDPNHPATAATTDFVSLRIDLVPTSGQNVTLNAFDLNGQLITSFVTPDASGATLQVSAPGIHSVQFIGTMDISGAAVDDFTFNPVVPVPEPSTIFLLLVGGAALWYSVQGRIQSACSSGLRTCSRRGTRARG
ncbi:MAG TPA: PEP-CTERM sorting domain-containing protein [Verrucomicrobiae bacterium]|nr:PEP-CTERM sorting domain-containing protein [Verrucomicrobiae bacterium]